MAWHRRHPAAFALGLFAGFEALHVVFALDAGRLFRMVLPGVPTVWIGPTIWGIYSVVVLCFIAVAGWWETVGLTRLGRRDAIPLRAYPVATGAVFLLLGVNIAPSEIVPVVIVGTPLIALNEEAFSRGVMLESLRPSGWRRAIIGSAVPFGGAHAVNVLAGGNLPFTVMQIAATTAGGITLAAIRIRSGSLWPVIALHIGLDLMALVSLTAGGVDSPILLPVLFAWLALNLTLWAYGWRLLRGRSDEMLDALYDGCPVTASEAAGDRPALASS